MTFMVSREHLKRETEMFINAAKRIYIRRHIGEQKIDKTIENRKENMRLIYFYINYLFLAYETEFRFYSIQIKSWMYNEVRKI